MSDVQSMRKMRESTKRISLGIGHDLMIEDTSDTQEIGLGVKNIEETGIISEVAIEETTNPSTVMIKSYTSDIHCPL